MEMRRILCSLREPVMKMKGTKYKHRKYETCMDQYLISENETFCCYSVKKKIALVTRKKKHN
jgi:hypothetical protein